MSSKKYYKSSTKEEIVICRVDKCRKSLKKQGYSQHLMTFHKEEDSNDLRVFGQAKFSWNPRTSKSVDVTTSVGPKAGEVEEGESSGDPNGDDDLTDNIIIEAHLEIEKRQIGEVVWDRSVERDCNIDMERWQTRRIHESEIRER